MVIAPTPELIESRQIAESQGYEFKALVDLDDARQKSNILDDVVGFLNAETAGHLIIGVDERQGVFERFRPLTGDADKAGLRMLLVLQDNIDPRPLGIEVRGLNVEGGFLLDAHIPEHRSQPYRNRISGAFCRRTGAKNTPMTAAELAAVFVARERHEGDVLRLAAAEEERLERRDVMQTNGAALVVGVLPREHYESGRKVFERGGMRPKIAPSLHNPHRMLFAGCDGGCETQECDFYDRMITRMFVGNDWFLHAHIVHPIDVDRERVNIPGFKNRLSEFMSELDAFATREELRGPFCITLSVRGLQRSARVGWAFPNVGSVGLPRPRRVESIADAELIDDFYQLVLGASRYA